jgi:hypothetical protein
MLSPYEHILARGGYMLAELAEVAGQSGFVGILVTVLIVLAVVWFIRHI